MVPGECSIDRWRRARARRPDLTTTREWQFCGEPACRALLSVGGMWLQPCDEPPRPAVEQILDRRSLWKTPFSNSGSDRWQMTDSGQDDRDARSFSISRKGQLSVYIRVSIIRYIWNGILPGAHSDSDCTLNQRGCRGEVEDGITPTHPAFSGMKICLGRRSMFEPFFDRPRGRSVGTYSFRE